MSTPGRRKALKALGRARRSNLRRVAAGKKPIVAGKHVAVSTLARRGGPASPKAARARLAKMRK